MTRRSRRHGAAAICYVLHIAALCLCHLRLVEAGEPSGSIGTAASPPVQPAPGSSPSLTCDDIVARTVDSPHCQLATQEGYLLVTPGGSLPTSDTQESNEIYWREYWDGAQDPAKTMPLLVVNGGPGGTHDYMLPFRYMACRASPSGTRYRIIFYDQLGSGRSAVRNSTGEPQAATAPSVWYLTAELQAMVQGVVLRKNSGPFHLLGQGFGGLIALSYATTYPDFTQEKMASLILASPAAPNMHSVVDGVVANMKAQMPAPYFQVLMSGNTTDPAWGAALANYNNLMVLRLTPTPDCVLSTVAGSSDAMRTALWGHQPWQLTGNAARTDLKRDLPRILVPVYAYIGQYDEYPQSILTDLSGGTTHIPWIHTEVVPDAGHLTHIDNFAYVYSGLNKWLDDTDSQPYFQVLFGKNGEYYRPDAEDEHSLQYQASEAITGPSGHAAAQTAAAAGARAHHSEREGGFGEAQRGWGGGNFELENGGVVCRSAGGSRGGGGGWLQAVAVATAVLSTAAAAAIRGYRGMMKVVAMLTGKGGRGGGVQQVGSVAACS